MYHIWAWIQNHLSAYVGWAVLALLSTIGLSFMLTPFVGAPAMAILLGDIICVKAAPKHGFMLALLISLAVMLGTWLGFQITLAREMDGTQVVMVFCLVSFIAFWAGYRWLLWRELPGL